MTPTMLPAVTQHEGPDIAVFTEGIGDQTFHVVALATDVVEAPEVLVVM
jgi:hypothetical protein